MPLNNRQLHFLMTELSRIRMVPVAFGYFDANPYQIHVAPDGYGWAAIINLIQGMAAGKRDLPPMQIHYSVNSVPDLASQGMIDFFGTIHANFVPATNMVEAVENTYTFKHIDPATILQRNLWPNSTFATRINAPPRDFRLDRPPNSPRLHRLYMALAYAYAGFRGSLDPAEDFQATVKRGHNIAAILVNRQGRVLATAVNHKSLNATYHAEVNLIQACVRTAGFNQAERFFVYTTLRPCRMCAAMITDALPQATIIYGQQDPGQQAQNAVSPQGGTYYLSTTRAKPLRLYSYDQGTTQWEQTGDDIGGALTGIARPGATTQALNSWQGAERMTQAGNFIRYKSDRYEDPSKESHRPEVKDLVDYLKTLLPG